MRRIQTHYDNLKVAPDAPAEVIHAAYRALARKYHPDLNNHNPEATRIMAIINASYAVLSDPDKRREHDEWIHANESAIDEHELSSPDDDPASQGPVRHQTEPQAERRRPQPNPYAHTLTYRVAKHVGRNLLWYAVAAIITLILRVTS